MNSERPDGLYGDIERLGRVIGGSLKESITVKLDPEVSVERIAVGSYVTIDGQYRTFFCILTDVRLEALDQRLMVNPPEIDDPVLQQVWAGTGIYGVLDVLPLLTIDKTGLANDGAQPVKSVPSHYSRVRRASEEDVEIVFGKEEKNNFVIGTPVDMETKVRLNLAELTKRSVGIFGKSGTGKTFLTRLILAGIVQKTDSVNLVFDMHNEYGWKGTGEGFQGGSVKGLKQLYPSKVTVFTLDRESSDRRGSSADFELRIGYDQIEPEDIVLLSETLNLSTPMIDSLYAVSRRYGRGWLAGLLAAEEEESRTELAASVGANAAALSGLWRRLQRLSRFGFLTAKAPADYLGQMFQALDTRRHVVLEFGRYSDLAAYIMVANLITRRIHARYVDKTERALGNPAAQPTPLVITIEEAHKFLNPKIADQTIFGTIARELRKFNVTLLVVDQRPSGIDEDVFSQIGTRLCCLLDNDKDVEAVLSGQPGKTQLKSVLARLESKQQALVFGHAVPMPVVIRTRDYGTEESYRTLGFETAAGLSRSQSPEEEAKSLSARLFGED